MEDAPGCARGCCMLRQLHLVLAGTTLVWTSCESKELGRAPAKHLYHSQWQCFCPQPQKGAKAS